MKRLVNLYISKNFLITFFQVISAFSLLIFFINLLDLLERVKDSEASFFAICFMAFLQIPNFLNEIAPSLVLISAITSFFFLSSKSEITIIRVSGFSIWQVLYPMALTAFLLGIFWITIFNSASIHMARKFNSLEGKYTRNDSREIIKPRGGIWLKQDNISKQDEEIIIKANSIYKETLQFKNITFWFFDKEGKFYKKIDAEYGELLEKDWMLEDAVVNDENLINKKLLNVKIGTNLEKDFVVTKVINNFQEAGFFSIFELPELIKDLKKAGFNTTKFTVYFNSLLSKPLLFLAMIFIACYFGLNHIRNNNSAVMIFLGVIVGLIFYIISSIINSLGSSGLIPTFASTWIIAIICLAIGTLLIYRKESF